MKKTIFYNTNPVSISTRLNEYMKSNFGYEIDSDLESLREAKAALEKQKSEMRSDHQDRAYVENMLMLETIKAMLKAHLAEAKPDFLDLDKDGDKKEPMKKAAKDAKKKEKTDEGIFDPKPEYDDAALRYLRKEEEFQRAKRGAERVAKLRRGMPAMRPGHNVQEPILSLDNHMDVKEALAEMGVADELLENPRFLDMAVNAAGRGIGGLGALVKLAQKHANKFRVGGMAGGAAAIGASQIGKNADDEAHERDVELARQAADSAKGVDVKLGDPVISNDELDAFVKSNYRNSPDAFMLKRHGVTESETPKFETMKKKYENSYEEPKEYKMTKKLEEGLLAQLNALLEGDAQNAEITMAARGIVDELQDMIEKLGKIQNDQLGPLADEMAYSHGADQAASFKGEVDDAIAGLLGQARATKDSVNNAVLVLSGEAPAADMSADMEMGGDMQDDMEDDISADVAGGDESMAGPVDEPLGRAKRD